MFLRFNTRKKDGKEHRYWSVVENLRLRSGKATQRTVLYLGEINDTQQAAWRKSLDVINEVEEVTQSICLFPEDRDIPADVLNGLRVKLSELTLERPRVFGDCWLACRLWDESGVGFVLASASARGQGASALVQSAGTFECAPVGGSGQQMASAPPLVSVQRDGPVARRRFCGGSQEPALPMSGSD